MQRECNMATTTSSVLERECIDGQPTAPFLWRGYSDTATITGPPQNVCEPLSGGHWDGAAEVLVAPQDGFSARALTRPGTGGHPVSIWSDQQGAHEGVEWSLKAGDFSRFATAEVHSAEPSDLMTAHFL